MFKFTPYICKSLWRHRTRTMLTVSGTAVALLVFCFVSSVQQGMRQLTQSRQSQRTLIVFQENRFCPMSSRLPEDYQCHLSRQAGVQQAVPVKVFTNSCRASLDSIVFHGLPPIQLQAARRVEIQSGSFAQFEQQYDGALIGQVVAARRNLKVGDKFTIGQITVLVAGIFASPVSADENLIYTHLEFLQRARGKNDVGNVTMHELVLTDDADAQVVSAAIDAHYRGGPVATTTRTKGMYQADTLADLAQLIGFIHWLGYACVALVLALVATTTVMSVQDRIKEHAVLQTLGVRPLRILRLVIAESMILSTAGGLIGVALGLAVLQWGGLCVAAEGVTIAFRPSLDLIWLGVGVSLIVGLLAGVAPGWQAAQTKIVDALRRG